MPFHHLNEILKNNRNHHHEIVAMSLVTPRWHFLGIFLENRVVVQIIVRFADNDA